VISPREVNFEGSVKKERLMAVVAECCFVGEVGPSLQTIESDFYSGIVVGPRPVEDFSDGETYFCRHLKNIAAQEYKQPILSQP
jgi:hypothetical protein